MNNTTNEEQKTPSGISQTLFRFVSLRNPQLAETSEKNLGFIIRPNYVTGVFDTEIENWAKQDPKSGTKFQALEAVAVSFAKTAFTKEKQIEGLVSDYYKLGKSLARNEPYDSDVFNRLSDSTSKIADQSLKSLWDNLIYQVVTQKDFYVKEAIIQTLKAVHYIDKYKDSEADKLEENLALAKKAKVVLPAKLFVEDAPVETENNVFTVDKTVIGNVDHIAEGSSAARILPVPNTRSLSVMQESRLKIEAEKNLQVTNALVKKDMLQSLKKELESIQKAYNKAYNKEYQLAYNNYQVMVRPILESNDALLDDLEATFDENTTDAAKRVAYKQLQLAEVPEFEFKFKNAINFSDLNAKLSTESFNLFIELFADYDAEAISHNIDAGVQQGLQIKSDTVIRLYGETATLSDDYLSYQDIFAKIDEGISEKYTEILSTADIPQKKYAKIGGVLMPVANQAYSNEYYLYAYQNKRLFTESNHINFVYNVGDSAQSASVINIDLVTDNGTFSEQLADIPVINGQLKLTNLFSDKTFGNINSLKVNIWFDNGTQSVLELDSVNQNSVISGTLKANNREVVPDSSSPDTFQPKHFGLKRLGIADYLKVEQSVHAYVPGEVSNIENVMASELRHKSSVSRDYSEITDTTSKSQETEQISDTTKATRTDMQTEVAKELEKQQSIEAHTSFKAGGKVWSMEVGGSYANSTAQHDSTRQAVAKSQEITERAMERVLTKVSEERIQKIIKEHTETNVHEFDNRGKAPIVGTQATSLQHITGVYRWVDKKMKNQIYNYGKRTMFEFMIPEPARLHALATNAVKELLTAPIDPRSNEAKEWQMKDYNVDESFLKHWANEYGVDMPDSLPGTTTQVDSNRYTQDEYNDQVISIPDNYVCKSVSIIYSYSEQKSKGWLQFFGYDGLSPILYKHSDTLPYGNLDFEGQLHLRFYQNWLNYTDFNITQYCELSSKYIIARKKEIFTKIIAAYTAAKEKFDAYVKAAAEAAAATEATNKEKATIFYRDTEANVLKHNCIAYLLQNQLGYGALGQPMSEDGNLGMQSFHMLFGDNLDNYTSLAKFMEQAFEWNIMDYTFYPYYWANKAHWQDLYLTEETDPLFRSFLQAGMARVIVTVKPGFEDAVNFFMTTGRIWNGGEVPVIGDPMYMSIVEELRQPTGIAQGNYWITRVPTALTILQAGSVGLKVDDALPIFKEDHPEECENPLELEDKSAFGQSFDAIMQHGLEGSTLN